MPNSQLLGTFKWTYSKNTCRLPFINTKQMIKGNYGPTQLEKRITKDLTRFKCDYISLSTVDFDIAFKF